VDFTHKKDTVSNHLNELEVYYYALKDFVKGTSDVKKLTIAFNAPESQSDQEELFNTARKQKAELFSFLPVYEVDDFTQSVATQEYQKFSEVFSYLWADQGHRY
jgi:hypothetical protein